MKLKIQLFGISAKKGAHAPLATSSYAPDKKRYLNWNIFHFYTIFTFIISLAKIIKQTLSNKEKNTLVFATFLLIISISTHLFIYRTTKQKNKNTKYLYKMYIVINIKKRSDFLNSKRREYLATTNFFYILSFSYYFQLKHSLI
jgi:uncharacterized membrane protein